MTNSDDQPAPHPRNRLNALTGREWLYATRSVALSGAPPEPLNDLSPDEWAAWTAPVLPTAYPTRGPAAAAHHIRRLHPSPKPPALMAEVIRFFTKPGAAVLDPFAGVGGTLLACSMTGRAGTGIDLSAEYIGLYQAAAAELKLEILPLLHGDAREILSQPAITGQTFDLVLTDPPYSSMLSRARTGQRRKQGRGAATPFTDDPADLGNLDYPAFLQDLRSIVAAAVQPLRVGGHLVLFVKDLQPTPEHHNMLHADVVAALYELRELRYRGYRIWYDQSAMLYPFGYPYSFVANQVHQFMLIFQKQALNSEEQTQ
ncbi:MAG: RsmD family RNA methyltransferase [Herpetosiphonaceae bacterium]|nr:RsmD family RNA methyltransferase [Herpetosiphonaceae bacterium]